MDATEDRLRTCVRLLKAARDYADDPDLKAEVSRVYGLAVDQRNVVFVTGGRPPDRARAAPREDRG